MSRSLFLTVTTALCAVPAQAVLLEKRHDCPGGAGSPPCDLKYFGSGDISATPQPPKHALPTPNPADSLFPGCTCPLRIPGMKPPVPMVPQEPIPQYIVKHLKPGEIEVVTVNVRLANEVRCDNVTLAADVAKLLKIPVKRVSVQPWSWTLGVPQSNYLAFVQEDHERCDCKSDNGKMLHDQGFKKAKASGATEGMVVQGHDTTVMTVAEYKALYAASTHDRSPVPGSAASASSAPGAAPGPAPGPALAAPAPAESGSGPAPAPLIPPPPPAARVQMLTRDPCLVQMLRQHTENFREKISMLLGVPMDKLIIDPPPVKGTVGLLQLESHVGTEGHSRQVPVMAVQHCNIADAADIMQSTPLSLVSQRNFTAAAAAMPMMMNYTVATPNGTNATNATFNFTGQRVALAMNLGNIHYDALAASWTMVSTFTHILKAAIAQAANVPTTDVKIALYPGSVIVEAKILPTNGSAPQILSLLNETVCNSTSSSLDAYTGLDPVKFGNGLVDCSILSLTLENPPFELDESNRAWIAFWAVVIQPPFDQEGSWRLLNLMNEMDSELSHLLPRTLARVPGLRYRALKEPNLANETRLPPPEDKAVGIKLPNPVDEEAAMAAELERMKKEKEHQEFVIKDKEAMEQMMALKAIHNGRVAQRMLKEADTRITHAAEVHAAAIVAPNRTRGIQLVNPSVLMGDDPTAESPYPWVDQLPGPDAMYLSLAQGPNVKPPPQHISGRSPHLQSLLSRRAPRDA